MPVQEITLVFVDRTCQDLFMLVSMIRSLLET
jgi:hypothetical protein